MAVVVLVVAASKTIFDMTYFNISYPFGHLYIYFPDFHSFGGGVGGGGGGGGNGIGGGISISWDDHLLKDSSILMFIEKA